MHGCHKYHAYFYLLSLLHKIIRMVSTTQGGIRLPDRYYYPRYYYGCILFYILPDILTIPPDQKCWQHLRVKKSLHKCCLHFWSGLSIPENSVDWAGVP